MVTGEVPWREARLADPLYREYVHNPRRYLTLKKVGKHIYYASPEPVIETLKLSDDFVDLMLETLKVFKKPEDRRMELAEVIQRLGTMERFLVPVRTKRLW